MNAVYYIKDTDFPDFEELYEVGAGEERLESADLPPFDPSCNVSRRNGFKNTKQDVFGANEMSYFCDNAEKTVRPGHHGHVFCFALEVSA